MLKVVVVRQGRYGEDPFRDDYDFWAGYIGKAIREVPTKATVICAETLGEAKKMVQNGTDVLVFISPEMIQVAGEIKKAHPNLKVVIFSGLPPGEAALSMPLFFVKKADVRGVEYIQKVVLD